MGFNSGFKGLKYPESQYGILRAIYGPCFQIKTIIQIRKWRCQQNCAYCYWKVQL